MGELKRERNISADMLRGIAILMVILGHTMSGCLRDFESSFVFNIVWSLQMPLFFLISGYVSRYSGAIESGRALGKLLLKRTLAYLVPWLVWSMLVRGLIFGETNFIDLGYLLWHMDNGYWFLVSIWMIAIAHGLSRYGASRLVDEKEKPIRHLVFTAVIYVVFAGVIMAVGLVAGLSFLGIKLTLYYMPFYLAGALYGKLRERIAWNKLGIFEDAAVFAALLLYLVIITRFKLFSMGEGMAEIAIRMAVSLCGCVALCGFVGKARAGGFKCRALVWAGEHSLELYLTHYILLSILVPEPRVACASLGGFGIALLNYVLTIVLSVVAIWLMQQNRFSRKILYWK